MKPNFRNRWRKPKGIQSKVRLCKRGNVGLYRIGMGKGKEKERKLVHNIKELKNEKEIIIANIGVKKKIELIKEAEKLGIKILNLNPKEFLKKIEEKRRKEREEKEKKEKRKKRKDKKEEKKETKNDNKLEKKIIKEGEAK